MGNLEEGKLTSALSAQQNVEVAQPVLCAGNILPARHEKGSRFQVKLRVRVQPGSRPSPGQRQSQSQRQLHTSRQVGEYFGGYRHLHDAVRPAATALVMIYRAVRVDGSHNDNTRTDPHQPQTLGPSDQTCRILAPLPRTHVDRGFALCRHWDPAIWPTRILAAQKQREWGMGNSAQILPHLPRFPLEPHLSPRYRRRLLRAVPISHAAQGDRTRLADAPFSQSRLPAQGQTTAGPRPGQPKP